MYSIVWLHSYLCPDLLGFCARMRSTCSLLYSCLFPLLSSLSHLATASALPISCVLCVRVCATNIHNTSDCLCCMAAFGHSLSPLLLSFSLSPCCSHPAFIFCLAILLAFCPTLLCHEATSIGDRQARLIAAVTPGHPNQALCPVCVGV